MKGVESCTGLWPSLQEVGLWPSLQEVGLVVFFQSMNDLFYLIMIDLFHPHMLAVF